MASFPINNAPETLDMATVHSIMDDAGGLAKSCRYAVVITPPGNILNNGPSISNIRNIGNPNSASIATSDLTYLCEATEFPGRGFESLDMRYYGPNFKIPQKTAYEDINMTFLCRNQSLEREFFDDWMELINPTSTYNFNFRDDYCTIIRIYHFSDVEDGMFSEVPEPTYAFTLYKAYPLLVNSQPVTWTDDNFLRLTVNFTYTEWRREGKDDTDDNKLNNLFRPATNMN